MPRMRTCARLPFVPEADRKTGPHVGPVSKRVVNRPSRLADRVLRYFPPVVAARSDTRSPALNPRPTTTSGDSETIASAGLDAASLDRIVAAIAAEPTSAALTAATRTQRSLTVRMWFANDTAP